MLVTFIGDPRGRTVTGFKASDPAETVRGGIRFPLGVPVEVSGDWWEAHISKIAGNGHWEIGVDAVPLKTMIDATSTFFRDRLPAIFAHHEAAVVAPPGSDPVPATEPAGSVVAADAPAHEELMIDALRAQAEALGVRVDKRWSEATLRRKIEDAQAAA